MQEPSLRLPTAHLSSTARIDMLMRGDTWNRRDTHIALDGEGAAAHTAVR